jgi:hypothetical protein
LYEPLLRKLRYMPPKPIKAAKSGKRIGNAINAAVMSSISLIIFILDNIG